MMTFDRKLARLLLEVCRYTYAAGFDDRKNAADKRDALQWMGGSGGSAADQPVMLHGSKTSVACVLAYPDRNIVAYMGTKTRFNSSDNALASGRDWTQNLEARPVRFKLASEQLGTGPRPHWPRVPCWQEGSPW